MNSVADIDATHNLMSAVSKNRAFFCIIVKLG